MLMETFDRLSRKEKYMWDVSIIVTIKHYSLANFIHRWSDTYVNVMYSHFTSNNCYPFQCGDTAEVQLVETGAPPEELRDRWKVVQKMEMTTQYSFAGDYTG